MKKLILALMLCVIVGTANALTFEQYRNIVTGDNEGLQLAVDSYVNGAMKSSLISNWEACRSVSDEYQAKFSTNDGVLQFIDVMTMGMIKQGQVPEEARDMELAISITLNTVNVCRYLTEKKNEEGS